MHHRPSITEIRRYVRGEMSPQEMYELERLSESDEMLMDIIRGVEAEFTYGAPPIHVATLQNKVQAHVHTLKQATTTDTAHLDTPADRIRPTNDLEMSPSRHDQNTLRRLWSYSSIAIAASLLVILSIGISFWINQQLPSSKSVNSPASERHAENTIGALQQPNTETRSATDTATAFEPIKRDPNTLAYQARSASSAKRIDQPIGTKRKQSLDTIPIQIIPSNAEELVSLSLSKDKSTVMAYRNTEIPASPATRMAARGSVATRASAISLTNMEMEDVKSITTGIVLDRNTQKPIRGAAIQGAAADSIITTDANGRFVLGSTAENTTILIQAAGFEPVQRAAEGSMRIEMTSRAQRQAPGSRGADKPAKLTKSEPVAGMIAYQVYTDSVARQKDLGSGEVTLLFDINTQGRPSNIRIKKGAGSPLSREAIKILEEGPDWLPNLPTSDLEWTIRF